MIHKARKHEMNGSDIQRRSKAPSKQTAEPYSTIRRPFSPFSGAKTRKDWPLVVRRRHGQGMLKDDDITGSKGQARD